MSSIANHQADRCPHNLCPWDACACPACESCEAVHSGPCVEMSAEAEDRLVNEHWERMKDKLYSAERWGLV
jgi:hypothetical protein